MLVALRIAFLLLCWLPAAAQARSSLDHAHGAQALLGREVWSRVISVHNDTRGGRYPRTVHALVFELAGILWFYTDVDGTQSFSLHEGRLEQEKADFAPLLRDIEPGFARWSVAAGKDVVPPRPGALPNGCFIESVVALRNRVTRGETLIEPRLLSFYAETRSGLRGHTVLAYDKGDVVEIIDPAGTGRASVFAQSLGRDPLALARAFEGGGITQARYLPLRAGTADAAMIAAGNEGRPGTVVMGPPTDEREQSPL